MTAPSKKSPSPGRNRAKGNTKTVDDTFYTGAMADAIEAMRKLRQQPGFDLASWDPEDRDAFMAQYALDKRQFGKVYTAARPADDRRFKWLAALTQAAGRGAITQKGLLVGLALFQRFNDETPYAWPSQLSLARDIGWTCTRGVRMGVVQLEEIGAVERIAAKNLPKDVTEVVFGNRKSGGSGRNGRAVAYKRIEADMWRNGNSGTDCSAIKRNEVFRLNHKGKPKQASPDSSPPVIDSPYTSAHTYTDETPYDVGDEQERRYG